jgi:signal transduction histidine kinase
VVDLLDEFGQRTSLTVRTELDSNLGSGLAAGSDIHVYRIVQEALQNVWKHSRAKTVRVSGSQTSVRLVVQVTDDGVGVLPGSDSEASLGMSGMRERAALLGGSFDWKSSSDGVVVTLEVPLESPDR